MAGEAGAVTWRAPGRVNLIGEHTDYNGGFVLPIALDLDCRVTVEPLEEPVISVFATNLGESRQFPLSELDAAKPRGDWSDYVVGVAIELRRAGLAPGPCSLTIASSVPVGSGLSSSAALEVASALALLNGREMDWLELAKACHRAENNFVGLPCGMMDQFISVFGESHAAMLLDCRNLAIQSAPLPSSACFLAFNSMVKHELGKSAYAERVGECRAAAEALGVPNLREASAPSLPRLSGKPLLRARHVISENRRVLDFVAASARGDLREMGRLMNESHASLRDDYEVSCRELDFLVEAACGVEGVHGARMTGGGFGGCIVVLLDEGAAPMVRQRVEAQYRERTGLMPAVYECRPSPGAQKFPKIV